MLNNSGIFCGCLFELVAILDAILNSAKCSRLPRWYNADSESRHSWLSFDTKNKTIDNIWRFHWYLPDYIPYDWSKCITSTTWPTRIGNLDWEGLYHEISSQRIKNTKNYILKLPSNVQTNFNPFHMFSAVVKVRHERDGIQSKLNMRTILGYCPNVF